MDNDYSFSSGPTPETDIANIGGGVTWPKHGNQACVGGVGMIEANKLGIHAPGGVLHLQAHHRVHLVSLRLKGDDRRCLEAPATFEQSQGNGVDDSELLDAERGLECLRQCPTRIDETVAAQRRCTKENGGLLIVAVRGCSAAECVANGFGVELPVAVTIALNAHPGRGTRRSSAVTLGRRRASARPRVAPSVWAIERRTGVCR